MMLHRRIHQTISTITLSDALLRAGGGGQPHATGYSCDMGYWGTGIFDGDTPCDMRDYWESVFQRTPQAETAAQRLQQCFDYDFTGCDRTDAWMVLAALEITHGVLRHETYMTALGLIDQGRSERLELARCTSSGHRSASSATGATTRY